MRTKILLALGATALASFTMACRGSDSPASDTTADTTAVDGTTAAGGTRPAPSGPVDPASIPAAPSPGCRAGDPASAGTAEVDRTRVDIDQDGEARWYLQHVPATAAPDEPLPLVLDLHGYSEGAQVHASHSDLSSYGDTHGFITLTPQGTGPIPRWDTSLGGTDLAFVGLVLDQAEAQLCVDTNRVYVTGLSNGAFLTSAVACQHADRVAAAAPVAGIRDIDGCAPSRPVPVVAFHGTADTYVSFDGGMGTSVADLPAPDGSGRSLGEADADIATERGPTVPEITAAWAVRNGCDATPTVTSVADDVLLATFACPPGADTELYEITDGGHTWPGSALSIAIESVVGRTTTSISANDIMWAFFQAHPLGA